MSTRTIGTNGSGPRKVHDSISLLHVTHPRDWTDSKSTLLRETVDTPAGEGSGWGQGSGAGEGLVEVGDEVGWRIEADREVDQAVGDTEAGVLPGREIGVGHGRRVGVNPGSAGVRPPAQTAAGSSPVCAAKMEV